MQAMLSDNPGEFAFSNQWMQCVDISKKSTRYREWDWESICSTDVASYFLIYIYRKRSSGLMMKHSAFCTNVITCQFFSFNKQQQQPFNGCLSGTTRVGRYQKKRSPAHAHPGQRTSFVTFLHLQRSMASSLFSLRA